MTDKPLVSIIIVNFNGKNHLKNCLESLKRVRYTRIEIILVDNNSVDGSVDFVRMNYPDVKIIKLERNFGFAEPNNLGAKNAKGEFLLFLNNDTIVDSNFIEELVDVAVGNSKIAILQSLLLKPDGSIDSSGDFVDTLGRAYSSRLKSMDIHRILSARGASMLVRKEAFWDLGGFDKNFFVSFEDVDLGWRAWIWGYEVVVVPKSIVYHTGGQTTKTISSSVQFHAVKNSLLLRLVNFEISFVLKSLVILFFVSFIRKCFSISILKDPEQGPPLPSFKKIVDGFGWIWANFKYVMDKRKLVNSRRTRSTEELKKLGLITKISLK